MRSKKKASVASMPSRKSGRSRNATTLYVPEEGGGLDSAVKRGVKRKTSPVKKQVKAKSPKKASVRKVLSHSSVLFNEVFKAGVSTDGISNEIESTVKMLLGRKSRNGKQAVAELLSFLVESCGCVKDCVPICEKNERFDLKSHLDDFVVKDVLIDAKTKNSLHNYPMRNYIDNIDKKKKKNHNFPSNFINFWKCLGENFDSFLDGEKEDLKRLIQSLDILSKNCLIKIRHTCCLATLSLMSGMSTKLIGLNSDLDYSDDQFQASKPKNTPDLTSLRESELAYARSRVDMSKFALPLDKTSKQLVRATWKKFLTCEINMTKMLKNKKKMTKTFEELNIAVKEVRNYEEIMARLFVTSIVDRRFDVDSILRRDIFHGLEEIVEKYPKIVLNNVCAKYILFGINDEDFSVKESALDCLNLGLQHARNIADKYNNLEMEADKDSNSTSTLETFKLNDRSETTILQNKQDEVSRIVAKEVLESTEDLFRKASDILCALTLLRGNTPTSLLKQTKENQNLVQRVSDKSMTVIMTAYPIGDTFTLKSNQLYVIDELLFTEPNSSQYLFLKQRFSILEKKNIPQCRFIIKFMSMHLVAYYSDTDEDINTEEALIPCRNTLQSSVETSLVEFHRNPNNPIFDKSQNLSEEQLLNVLSLNTVYSLIKTSVHNIFQDTELGLVTFHAILTKSECRKEQIMASLCLRAISEVSDEDNILLIKTMQKFDKDNSILYNLLHALVCDQDRIDALNSNTQMSQKLVSLLFKCVSEMSDARLLVLASQTLKSLLSNNTRVSEWFENSCRKLENCMKQCDMDGEQPDTDAEMKVSLLISRIDAVSSCFGLCLDTLTEIEVGEFVTKILLSSNLVKLRESDEEICQEIISYRKLVVKYGTNLLLTSMKEEMKQIGQYLREGGKEVDVRDKLLGVYKNRGQVESIAETCASKCGAFEQFEFEVKDLAIPMFCSLVSLFSESSLEDIVESVESVSEPVLDLLQEFAYSANSGLVKGVSKIVLEKKGEYDMEKTRSSYWKQMMRATIVDTIINPFLFSARHLEFQDVNNQKLLALLLHYLLEADTEIHNAVRCLIFSLVKYCQTSFGDTLCQIMKLTFPSAIAKQQLNQLQALAIPALHAVLESDKIAEIGEKDGIKVLECFFTCAFAFMVEDIEENFEFGLLMTPICLSFKTKTSVFSGLIGKVWVDVVGGMPVSSKRYLFDNEGVSNKVMEKRKEFVDFETMLNTSTEHNGEKIVFKTRPTRKAIQVEEVSLSSGAVSSKLEDFEKNILADSESESNHMKEAKPSPEPAFVGIFDEASLPMEAKAEVIDVVSEVASVEDEEEEFTGFIKKKRRRR